MITNHDKEIFKRKEIHEINQRQSEILIKHLFPEWGNKKPCSDSEECTVSLPCKPGQKAWALLENRPLSGGRAWRISKRIVNSITVFEGGDMQLCLMDPKLYTDGPKRNAGHEQNICWFSDKIGKELFFSLEEAEEALQKKIR